MRAYLIKRLLLIFPTLFGITLITMLIIQMAPGDPTRLKAGIEQGLRTDEQIDQESYEIIRRQFDLDRPFHVRYVRWVWKLVRFDFGISIKDRRPVLEKIAEALPVTIRLNVISIFLIYLISLPLGVYSDTHQDTLRDRVITVILFILYSLPSFWLAMMLILLVGRGGFLNWLPFYGLSVERPQDFTTLGVVWETILRYLLPVFCLTYGGLAFTSRYTRGTMLEVIRQDYIRTARAKGLSERVVVFKHALRNSLIPIVTLFATLLPAMIGGSVIIESIFSIPGMGRLGFESVLARDYPTVMGIATISALLTLAGILLTDLLYAVVDPRITFN